MPNMDKWGMISRTLHPSWLKYPAMGAAVTVLFAFAIYAINGTNPAEVIRIILGIIYVMFIPGFLLCWIVFPDDKEIDTVERLGLSMGLSIPLSLSAVLISDQMFKIKLTPWNIIQMICLLDIVLIIAGIVRYEYRQMLAGKAQTLKQKTQKLNNVQDIESISLEK